MTDLLKNAYDPEFFRQQGHRLVDMLADYLHQVHNSPSQMKVLDWIPPEELLDKWQKDFESAPHLELSELFGNLVEETIHLHHPQYLGHQTSNVLPAAALATLAGGFLDPGMGVYEQGTSGVAFERLLIQDLAARMGMTAQADGFLTSGGTLGNLTALLCARQVMIEQDVWEKGYEGKKYGFLVSAEAHYSVARAVQVMGMGSGGVVPVPVNENYQLDAECLEEYYQKATDRGIQIIGAVASACSTAVGAYDPIDQLADFCEEKKLWLHVDAAHGGCVLFSKKYKHLLRGIERADSVILDFHKMLMTPSLVTALVFRQGNYSYQTFAQKASYLWEEEGGQEWYNLAKRTFELTKTSMSIRIYAMLRTYGEKVFEENVDVLYDLAKWFSEIIAAEDDFQMAVPFPESNILCFRYFREDLKEEELDDINLRIRESIARDGEFFIVQTRVDGRLFLRTSLMNPFTNEDELRGLLRKIKKLL